MRPGDESSGGDPACWAHLFDETEAGELIATVDLSSVAEATDMRGPAWTTQSEDLNVNLLVFRAGEGVADHVNTELDVLIIGVLGEGLVKINGETHPVRVGQLILVPKGSVRSTRASSERFSYLTCHRRRSGLFPTLSPGSQ